MPGRHQSLRGGPATDGEGGVVVALAGVLAGWDEAVHGGFFFGGVSPPNGAQVVLELVESAGTDDGAGDDGVTEQPGEGPLGQALAACFREREQGLRDVEAFVAHLGLLDAPVAPAGAGVFGR